jgi:hypothetical protein
MRNSTIVLSALALGCAALFISAEEGVAEGQNKDRTGAPGSSATCGTSNCHDDNMFQPNIGVQIIDPQTAMPITEYIPGTSYVFSVTVMNNGASVTGMQATALLAEDNSNAGSFSLPGPNSQIEDVDGRHFLEHKQPNEGSEFVGFWQAPATGSGTVDIYAAGIAGNGNGGSAGDGFAGAISFSISEGSVSVEEQTLQFEAFVVDQVAKVTTNKSGELRLYDLSGKLLQLDREQAGSSSISISDVNGGTVLMYFKSGNRVATQQVLVR